mmetsp:Transcript_65237/g.115865  ORF Transcript_65237/g.115865 Transcript_65237/m.115865 type:complete len:126 (-) Transcript_65237:123-500(-)
MTSFLTRQRSSNTSGTSSEVSVHSMMDYESSANTLILLHCLFAMVFAAATLGVLNCLGFVVRSNSCCPKDQGYSSCEIWQDLRSMLSFFLGALLCCLLTRNDKCTLTGQEVENGPGKAQLYTCLL